MSEFDKTHKPHFNLSGYYVTLPYKYPRAAHDSFVLAQQNRAIHGQIIKQQLENIHNIYELQKETPLDEGLVRDDVVYTEFTSEWGMLFNLNNLDSNTATEDKAMYQLLNVRKESRIMNGAEQSREHATLLLREGGISSFLDKVDKYLTENTKNKEGQDTGHPKNEKLISNINAIHVASLRSFWTDEPEIPFPETDNTIWWEVWFRKTNNDTEKILQVYNNLSTLGCTIGQSEFVLPEHRIRLIKGTKTQLASSLLLLDNLAELRHPIEVNDFVIGKEISYQAQTDYLKDIINRTQRINNGKDITICLLDSGVNNKHSLIAPFLPDANLYAYKEGWGKFDSYPNAGHGTAAASLAIYGDLTDALSSSDQIQVFHNLESYKIFNPRDKNTPELYAWVTSEAVSSPIIDRPDSIRIYCMTITDEQTIYRGRPSSWSSAVDQLTFGSIEEPDSQKLFVLSSGNVDITNKEDYPDVNCTQSIHDPAQSYNAISVGSYTRKDKLNADTGQVPLVKAGGMGPHNTTSLLWEDQWPNKPDIVMEGGNCSTDETGTIYNDEALKLVAADAEFPHYLFCTFGDSSAAAPLAARMAAQLSSLYPDFWPETIRGLIVHSASWTDVMLDGKKLSEMLEPQKRTLLRCYGYGVPNLDAALYSASNSVTLIAERFLKPYKLENSTIKYNEYHLFELPWPKDVLRDLVDTEVTLTVTLSYFIEPNPGAKSYLQNYQYHSHSLDFSLIKAAEDPEVFKRRISSAHDLPKEDQNGKGEKWLIGRSGSRGSIRKDFIHTTGSELSTRNMLAVYPKGGWYKTRKKLNRFNESVRYSLIVSIKTENEDIYTPVLNQIPVTAPVTV